MDQLGDWLSFIVSHCSTVNAHLQWRQEIKNLGQNYRMLNSFIIISVKMNRKKTFFILFEIENLGVDFLRTNNSKSRNWIDSAINGDVEILTQ